MTTSYHNLELYYSPRCFFCKGVLRVVEEHKLKVTMWDTDENSDCVDKLLADTGRQTVPCLYIDGKPMHESSEIIEWLESNLDRLEKS